MRPFYFKACLGAMLYIGHCEALISDELCPYTDIDSHWSSQCFNVKGKNREVKRKYRKNIITGSQGVVTVLISDQLELVAINRSGRVMIPSINFSGDFDYPDSKTELYRFSTRGIKDENRKSKCGYFDKYFNIKIKAIYDHCQPFRDGYALVCNNCEKYCTETECQNSILVGGMSYTFDKNGKPVESFKSIELEKYCTNSSAYEVMIRGGNKFLKCRNDEKNNPFIVN